MESELHVSDTLKITEKSTFLVHFGTGEKRGSLLHNEKVLDLESQLKLKKVAADPDPIKKGWRGFMGIFLTLVHVICFSLGGLLIKILKEYHPFSMGIYRFQGLFFPSLVVLVFAQVQETNKLPDKKKNLGQSSVPLIFETVWPLMHNGNWKRASILLLRCIFGTSAILLFFYSLQFISVADSMVLASAAPVFVTLLAYFCLGEPCGIFPVFLSVLTIGGVIIICRPPLLTGAEEFDSNVLIGSLLGTISMLLTVFAFVTVRYLKEVHFAIISAAFGFWGTLQSVISCLVIGVFNIPQGAEDIFLTLAVAVLTFGAQASLTIALKIEEAGPVSLIRSTSVIFAFIWQFIFLGVKPDIYSLTGAIVVLIGIIGTAFRKWVSTLPVNHKWRAMFFFVLK